MNVSGNLVYSTTQLRLRLLGRRRLKLRLFFLADEEGLFFLFEDLGESESDGLRFFLGFGELLRFLSRLMLRLRFTLGELRALLR